MEGIVNTNVVPAVEVSEITSHGTVEVSEITSHGTEELEPPEQMDFDSSFREDGSAVRPPPRLPRWKAEEMGVQSDYHRVYQDGRTSEEMGVQSDHLHQYQGGKTSQEMGVQLDHLHRYQGKRISEEMGVQWRPPPREEFEYKPPLRAEFKYRPPAQEEFEYRPQPRAEFERRPPLREEFEYRPQSRAEFERRPPLREEFEYRPQPRVEFERRPPLREEFEYIPHSQVEFEKRPPPPEEFEYIPHLQVEFEKRPPPSEESKYRPPLRAEFERRPPPWEVLSMEELFLRPPLREDFGGDGSAVRPPPNIQRWEDFKGDGSAIRPPPQIPRRKDFGGDGNAIRPIKPPSISKWKDFGGDGNAIRPIKPPSISRWMDFHTSGGENDIALADWMDGSDKSGGEDDSALAGSKSDSSIRGGGCSTTSCSWSLTYKDQVHNLKEYWKKALTWKMKNSTFASFRLKNKELFETSPWFASIVEQLRVDPYWDSCKFESDQSPLGEFVTGVKMTSLDLAILMGDRNMVRKILKRCTSIGDEIIRGPIIDRKRALELSSSVGISLDLKKIHFIYTPLHLAVEGGDSLIVRVLLHFGADVDAQNWQGNTPLDCAYKMENETILQRLLEKDIERKDLLHLAMLHQDVYSRKQLPISPNVNALDSHGRTPLHYLATKHYLRFDFMQYIVHYLARGRTLDLKALDSRAFYVAVLYCNTGLVIILLDFFKNQIRLNEACNQDLGPPIQIAFERGDSFRDIERALMECEPVKGYMDKLYRDCQVYVDAANAILVGAALIASVTFASWLQPPLNYTSYSGEGYSISVPAPATSNLNYVDVEHNIALRAFWILNALSFYFSIAAVVCGARTVLPRSHLFIKKTVEKLCTNLLVTSILLACSVLFVILAFAIAGTVVLTPLLSTSGL